MTGVRRVLQALAAVAVILGFSSTAQATPVRVKTGMFVTSISAINTADSSARFIAFVWFVFPQGSFDPMKDVEFFGRSVSVTEVARAQLESGDEYVAVRADIVSEQKYDLRSYPFDRQSIVLRLESQPDATRVILAPDLDDTRIADFAQLNNWRFDGFRFHEHAIEYDTKFGYRTTLPRFSRLTFVVDMTRQKSAIVIEKFIGFTVAFLISCLIYLVAPGELGTRIGMATGSIFASVGNRYSLEGQLGFDSAFGLVDQVSVLTFSSIGIALLTSLLVKRTDASSGTAVASRLNQRMGAASTAVHLSLAILAFWYAMS